MANRPRLRRAWPIIASLAILWLASCEPPVTTLVPASPEVPLAPTASLESIAAATAPATAATTAAATATLVPVASATAQEQPLAIAPLVVGEVGRFELLELDIQTDIVPANPFDTEELNIRVEFTSPSGKTVDVGTFWYQAYDAADRIPMGEPGWKARFTPTETGEWTAVARIPSRGLESAAVSFRAVESDQPGFVRVHPSNPRYFAFDDGSFFFPIGLNIAWWSGAGNALTDYRKWMNLFASNGGNTIRVWMAEW